eukprot:TRINITY_DN7941_c0_g1_i2.p1 TRINITY_DN7941_c0_g1~~TRINITY_DN7941_c0_g1_i2.p1  ORF type:complete len:142 (+),score=33.96 TRINITY_DN7941_c0_g1_i2:358-783(+)
MRVGPERRDILVISGTHTAGEGLNTLTASCEKYSPKKIDKEPKGFKLKSGGQLKLDNRSAEAYQLKLAQLDGGDAIDFIELAPFEEDATVKDNYGKAFCRYKKTIMKLEGAGGSEACSDRNMLRKQNLVLGAGASGTNFGL